jgi:hypothetical protein
MSDPLLAPEANAQASSISNPDVVIPVEPLTNSGNKPIDNVVPYQGETCMSPAPVQSGGNCMLRRGGNCMLRSGGRRSFKKHARKSNKKHGRKSHKKHGRKSNKKHHK